MKFIELNNKLKEQINNIYNLVGDDYFLIKQSILTFKSALVKDLEEFNYIKLDGQNLTINELDAQISTLPMGNDLRLIVLDKPSAEIIKFLIKYDFTDSQTILVCIGAEKLTNATEVDCSKIDKSDITKYIMTYLSKVNVSIEEQALDYLIEATNGNMSKIVNELNKLVSYCLNDSVITIDIAHNLIANSNEYAIYTLTNAIDNKDFTSYQKILNEISKFQSVSEIFAYLGKHFRRMQYVALNKNDEELAKILGIKPYAIKMSRQNVNKNGIKFYINLYEKYIDLDYKIKNGKISVNNALYELIF